MKKKVVILLLLLLILFSLSFKTFATNIPGFFQDNGKVGKLNHLWTFYYTDRNGSTREIPSFHHDQAESLIVINDVLYVRAGSLITQFEMGVSLDGEKGVIHFYHSDYVTSDNSDVGYSPTDPAPTPKPAPEPIKSPKEKEKPKEKEEMKDTAIYKLPDSVRGDIISDIQSMQAVLSSCNQLASSLDRGDISVSEARKICNQTVDGLKVQQLYKASVDHPFLHQYAEFYSIALTEIRAFYSNPTDDQAWHRIYAVQDAQGLGRIILNAQ